MKKLLFSLTLFFAIATTVSAQTKDSTATGTKYWYYPSSNVYYNNESGSYWYYDAGTTKWSSGKKLPDTYVIDKQTQHYDVYYNGTDVWNDNKTHQSKYTKPAEPAK